MWCFLIVVYALLCIGVVVVCSCLFWFFFFKQKTAYEMRISDWSSDVCSSDLFGALPLPLVVLAAAFAADVRNLRLGALGPHARCLHRHTLSQIGRASCRERVCQYV